MWAQFINIVIGLGILLLPNWMEMSQTAADHHHITGPLIMTFAITALWEVNRNVRLFNLLIAAWLLLAPFVWSFGTSIRVADMVAGIAIILFSLQKGKTKTRYGGGWRSLFQKNPLHMQEKENKAA